MKKIPKYIESQTIQKKPKELYRCTKAGLLIVACLLPPTSIPHLTCATWLTHQIRPGYISSNKCVPPPPTPQVNIFNRFNLKGNPPTQVIFVILRSLEKFKIGRLPPHQRHYQQCQHYKQCQQCQQIPEYFDITDMRSQSIVKSVKTNCKDCTLCI